MLRLALKEIGCSFHVNDMFNLVYLIDLLSRDDSFLKRDYSEIAKVQKYAETPLKKNEEFTIFKMELIRFVNNLLANKKSGKFSLETKFF